MFAKLTQHEYFSPKIPLAPPPTPSRAGCGATVVSIEMETFKTLKHVFTRGSKIKKNDIGLECVYSQKTPNWQMLITNQLV